MKGIYQDEFIDILNEYLPPVKEKSKNIVCRCPFCEMNENGKDHYHLWISTEIPIFHCFSGSCSESGSISKLMKKLLGKDISNKMIDKDKIKVKKKVDIGIVDNKKPILLPDLDSESFILKKMYIKKRTKFANVDLKYFKGLVFDVEKFIKINDIHLDDKQKRMIPFLQTNFVGFISENNSTIVFRNIDADSSFRYYKISLQESGFSDFYKIKGNAPESNDIVLAEGIFDILTEQIFDYTSLKNKVRLYAAILSTHYESLIRSIVFREQLFRPNVHILSDHGIDISFYKKIKENNSHIINTMKVYYNRTGKDFNVTPVYPVELVI